jgi:hypothetical protein
VKQRSFEQLHQEEWQLFEEACLSLKKRNKNVELKIDFPSAYRSLTQHLSIAYDRGYSEGLIQTLQRMVFDGHEQLYRRAPMSQGLLGAYLFRDFPSVVRRN